MRIDVGAGYRVYFMRRGETVYLLLAGGDKSTQTPDIRRAKSVARDLKAADAH
jgi:putative addiction module killer protein